MGRSENYAELIDLAEKFLTDITGLLALGEVKLTQTRIIPSHPIQGSIVYFKTGRLCLLVHLRLF